jgi:hypothetical protein
LGSDTRVCSNSNLSYSFYITWFFLLIINYLITQKYILVVLKPNCHTNLKISWNINLVNDIFFDSVENLSMYKLQIDKTIMQSSILIVELVCFIEFDSNLSRNCANKHKNFISRCYRNWRVHSKSLSKWVWYVVFITWSLRTVLSNSFLEYSWDRLVEETTNRELNASLCFDN